MSRRAQPKYDTLTGETFGHTLGMSASVRPRPQLDMSILG